MMRKFFCWCCIPLVLQAQPTKPPVRADIKKDSLLPINFPLSETDQLANNLSQETEEEEMPGNTLYPSLLQASRDPLLTASTFDWASARFRWRGYPREATEYRLQGALLTNPITGQNPWYIFYGMNSTIRYAHAALGITPVDYSVGNLGGSSLLNGTGTFNQPTTTLSSGYAGNRKTIRFSVAHTGRLPARGWSGSAFFQWVHAKASSQNPGMQQALIGLLGVQKIFNNQDRLYAFMGFAPQLVSKQSAVTRELFELSGTFRYNANWGLQQNQIRFAATRTYQYPFLSLTHEHAANQHTIRKLSLAAYIGFQGDQGLDWYQAADPRPDYYRYMPSYASDTLLKRRLTQLFQEAPDKLQINWQQLYATNQQSNQTIRVGNPIAGSLISGNRSRYILEQRRINTRFLSLNYFYHTLFNQSIDFSAGATWQFADNRYRKKLLDLLGGDFYVNLNGFAEDLLPNNPQANQHDIAQPNRLIYPGNFFGYDYALRQTHAEAWIQWQQTNKKIDWFVGARVASDRFMRIGYVANGLFPLHSLGSSIPITNSAYFLKGGVTYKIRGNHFLFIQTAIQQKSPLAGQLYIHPRYSSFIRNDIAAEKTRLAEGGWIFRSPTISSRLSVFVSQTRQGQEIQQMYHDAQATWVNHVVSNIGLLHRGIEWSGSAGLHADWMLEWATSFYQVNYRGRPTGKLYADNSEILLATESLQIDGYRLGGTPQQAVHLGISYRSSNGWMASASINQLSNHWVSLQYLRRTSASLSIIDTNTNQPSPWLTQEKLPNLLTIHLMLGYNVRLAAHGSQPSPALRLFLSARNLPNAFFISGGYEQQRLATDIKKQQLFANKYFFSPGSYLSLTLQLSL
jgi:hypothetical protein